MAKRDYDPLYEMREELLKYIEANYKTVEEFCWDKDLSKATISNFINGKKDFQVSTLLKIAKSMGMVLIIELK